MPKTSTKIPGLPFDVRCLLSRGRTFPFVTARVRAAWEGAGKDFPGRATISLPQLREWFTGPPLSSFANSSRGLALASPHRRTSKDHKDTVMGSAPILRAFVRIFSLVASRIGRITLFCFFSDLPLLRLLLCLFVYIFPCFSIRGRRGLRASRGQVACPPRYFFPRALLL